MSQNFEQSLKKISSIIKLEGLHSQEEVREFWSGQFDKQLKKADLISEDRSSSSCEEDRIIGDINQKVRRPGEIPGALVHGTQHHIRRQIMTSKLVNKLEVVSDQLLRDYSAEICAYEQQPKTRDSLREQLIHNLGLKDENDLALHLLTKMESSLKRKPLQKEKAQAYFRQNQIKKSDKYVVYKN